MSSFLSQHFIKILLANVVPFIAVSHLKRLTFPQKAPPSKLGNRQGFSAVFWHHAPGAFDGAYRCANWGWRACGRAGTLDKSIKTRSVFFE